MKWFERYNGKFLVGTGSFLVILLIGLIAYLDYHHTQKEAEKKTLWYFNQMLRPIRQTQRMVCRQTLATAEFIGAPIKIDTARLLLFSPAFQDSVLDLIGDFENRQQLWGKEKEK